VFFKSGIFRIFIGRFVAQTNTCVSVFLCLSAYNWRLSLVGLLTTHAKSQTNSAFKLIFRPLFRDKTIGYGRNFASRCVHTSNYRITVSNCYVLFSQY